MSVALLTQKLTELAVILGTDISTQRLKLYTKYLERYSTQDVLPLLDKWPRISMYFPSIQELAGYLTGKVEGVRYAQQDQSSSKHQLDGPQQPVSQDEARTLINELYAKLKGAEPVQAQVMERTPDRVTIKSTCQLCQAPNECVECLCTVLVGTCCIRQHFSACADYATYVQSGADPKHDPRPAKKRRTRKPWR